MIFMCSLCFKTLFVLFKSGTARNDTWSAVFVVAVHASVTCTNRWLPDIARLRMWTLKKMHQAGHGGQHNTCFCARRAEFHLTDVYIFLISSYSAAWCGFWWPPPTCLCRCCRDGWCSSPSPPSSCLPPTSFSSSLASPTVSTPIGTPW